jgi:hypothetical protein
VGFSFGFAVDGRVRDAAETLTEVGVLHEHTETHDWSDWALGVAGAPRSRPTPAHADWAADA